MREFFSGTRFTGGFWGAAVSFFALAGFASAAAGPEGPGLDHFSNAWVVLVLFALVGLEAWLFWSTWKHRVPEEEPLPEILRQASRPVLRNRAAIQRKRTPRERVKVPV